ncbi:MAG: hypothetical protein JHC96_10505 [Brevundimonas sp.]|uniref:glycine-rich domain-containing protein n=1 Tax=Brevundimonas sp. TaxID=1871086 RepID=UPI001A1E4F1F|nr:hypothetical protein [Brevundimonas sp.]MBJ7319219.1 hypothetical protein [Brevundimonas sp.]
MIDADILSLDLDPIAFKLAYDERWSLKEIDQTILEYRAMLQLIRSSDGQSLAPSRAIDTVWHHHILDTQKYIADCEALFGRYVHHFPYSGLFSEDAAEQQRARFDRTFTSIRAILSTEPMEK